MKDNKLGEIIYNMCHKCAAVKILTSRLEPRFKVESERNKKLKEKKI